MNFNEKSKRNALKQAPAPAVPDTGNPPETNPLTKLAMAAAGIAAGVIADKLLKQIWEKTFKEQVPDKKFAKSSAKELKSRQKLAKKAGASKAEVNEMRSEFEQIPAWRIALWTFVSGTVLAGAKLLAAKGAQKGSNKLVYRRPSNKRG